MEGIQNRIWNILQQKKREIIGIHANAILDKNIANEREIQKRMDAVYMDPDIAKTVLWEEIYQEMKTQLQLRKTFLNPQNKEEISILPEFQTFLKQYIREQEKIQQNEIQTKELANKKHTLENMDLPENIEAERTYLKTVKNIFREFIDEKQEKNEWQRRIWGDIIKKSKFDEPQKKEKSNQIYDFIFDYMENSGNKKKRKIGEESSDFYKRIDVDYMINQVRKTVQDLERKLNEKIAKRKEKTKGKIKTTKQEEKTKRDYTQEAQDIFCKNIQNYPSIKEDFYLPEDLEDITHIQRYFKNHLEQTIPSPNKESLIKDHTTPLHTIIRAEDKIRINPNDYLEIERRKIEYKKRFRMGDRNPKEYIFDRLIEYIGKDILEYKIKKIIEENTQYRWTKVRIEKTDTLDDSSAWADYIVTYSIPGKQKDRIAAIDLFISEKFWGRNEEENNDKRQQKREWAKAEKIPYSTYIHTFENKEENSYIMEPLKRYVEQLDPTLIYTVMTQKFRDKKTDISKLLDEFDAKGRLYTSIRETTKNNKETTKVIENQLHQNIFAELDKVAA